MENFGLGAGLAALAFWGFIATVAVAGIWDGVRKREAQHETLRRLAQSDHKIDKELLEKLFMLNSGGEKRYDREFQLTALWILPVSVGMALLGLIMGQQYPEVLTPILGTAALLACLGVGFWVASKIAERWYKEEKNSARDPLIG